MDKYLVITGANNGIALECVQQFMEEWNIIAISKSINNLELIHNDKLSIMQCACNQL
jgi:short-subunit dehydrogenase